MKRNIESKIFLQSLKIPVDNKIESSVFSLLTLCTLWSTIFILIVSGCKKEQIIAGGQRDIILVLAEEDDWSKTKGVLKDALERDVYTPNRETIYELMHGLPQNFSSYIYGKNLILIGYLGGLSEASNLISTLLTDNAKEMVQRREAFIFDENNPWAFGQYLLVIASPGKPELVDIIKKNRNTIFNYFEKASYERTKWLIYSAGREKGKEEKLKEEFNFSIDLPIGFYWMGEDSIKTFAKFVRKFPYRLISIGWKKKMVESISFNDACKLRDSIGAFYLDNDIIVKKKTDGKSVEFLGREGYKLEGIWENNEKIMGGSFRTYFFNDTLQQRFYIIDIHVFAPGKKKWFYLMELEGVAETFRTFPVHKVEK